MSLLSFINLLLALGTILAQVFIFASIAYLLFFRSKKPFIGNFFGNHGMVLAFLTALAASFASIFYSQFAGFLACELCWYQRVFMYPSVIILGIALFRKRSCAGECVMPLAILGLLVALYHNAMYYVDDNLGAVCQLFSNNAVSCAQRYVEEFGYVTIPMMSLTSFSLIIIFLIFANLYRKSQKIL